MAWFLVGFYLLGMGITTLVVVESNGSVWLNRCERALLCAACLFWPLFIVWLCSVVCLHGTVDFIEWLRKENPPR